MSNHINLTHGIITCTISTAEPLPAEAFTILGHLVGEIEHCAAALADVMPTQDETAP